MRIIFSFQLVTMYIYELNYIFRPKFRLQVFHCLERAEQGGETVLVDGFKAAHLLKEENQRYYECLSSTNVEWQYVSETFRQMFTKPVINTYVDGERLEQIR